MNDHYRKIINILTDGLKIFLFLTKLCLGLLYELIEKLESSIKRNIVNHILVI